MLIVVKNVLRGIYNVVDVDTTKAWKLTLMLRDVNGLYFSDVLIAVDIVRMDHAI